MSLIEYPDVVQGTEEWHDQRRGIVTASVVGQLLTASTLKPADNPTARGVIASLVAERITGRTEPTFMTNDMMRGVEHEPLARAAYAEHFAPVTETGFMVRTVPAYTLGFSPDGLVGSDGLIEIKSRRQKKHLQTILDDAVPPENYAQLQAGLLVSGRAWIDYVSFTPGMPLYVKRVYPEPRWQVGIAQAAQRFEEVADEMVANYNRSVQGLPETEYIDDMEVELKL